MKEPYTKGVTIHPALESCACIVRCCARCRQRYQRVGLTSFEKALFRRLSIKLCLKGESRSVLESRLEQGVELIESGENGAGTFVPTAVFEQRDGQSEIEL